MRPRTAAAASTAAAAVLFLAFICSVRVTSSLAMDRSNSQPRIAAAAAAAADPERVLSGETGVEVDVVSAPRLAVPVAPPAAPNRGMVVPPWTPTPPSSPRALDDGDLLEGDHVLASAWGASKEDQGHADPLMDKLEDIGALVGTELKIVARPSSVPRSSEIVSPAPEAREVEGMNVVSGGPTTKETASSG